VRVLPAWPVFYPHTFGANAFPVVQWITRSNAIVTVTFQIKKLLKLLIEYNL